jgi:hypothetical protein
LGLTYGDRADIIATAVDENQELPQIMAPRGDPGRGPLASDGERKPRFPRRRAQIDAPDSSRDRAQQGVVADRHAQTARKTRRRSASKDERQTMDDLIEPSRAPRPRPENVIVKAFCEDATRP